jgi:hypothetical protein
MAKQFSGNGCASGIRVTRFSLFARTVIGDTAIAAPGAVSKPGGSSGEAPTDGINTARRGGSITATGSASIGNGAVKMQFA